MLAGIGHNGKSVLTGIMEWMHEGKVSHVTLASLIADIRFGASGFENMDINIDTEMKGGPNVADAYNQIKAITTPSHKHRS